MKQPQTIAEHLENYLQTTGAPDMIRNHPDIKACFFDGSFAFVDSIVNPETREPDPKRIADVFLELHNYYHFVPYEGGMLNKIFLQGSADVPAEALNAFKIIFISGAQATAGFITEGTFTNFNFNRLDAVIDELNDIVRERLTHIN